MDQSEYCVFCKPAPERLFIVELREELCVVLEERRHDMGEHLIVFDPYILLFQVLTGVLIGGVGRHLGWDIFGDKLVDAVSIGLRNVTKLIVEGLQDVRKPLQFGIWPIPTARCGDRFDLGVCIG